MGGEGRGRAFENQGDIKGGRSRFWYCRKVCAGGRRSLFVLRSTSVTCHTDTHTHSQTWYYTKALGLEACPHRGPRGQSSEPRRRIAQTRQRKSSFFALPNPTTTLHSREHYVRRQRGIFSALDDARPAAQRERLPCSCFCRPSLPSPPLPPSLPPR